MSLLECRKKTGLSQAKFASKFNIPLNTYFHWEQGRHKPPKYVVSMIETILNTEQTNAIPVDWLERKAKEKGIDIQGLVDEWKQSL